VNPENTHMSTEHRSGGSETCDLLRDFFEHIQLALEFADIDQVWAHVECGLSWVINHASCKGFNDGHPMSLTAKRLIHNAGVLAEDLCLRKHKGEPITVTKWQLSSLLEEMVTLFDKMIKPADKAMMERINNAVRHGRCQLKLILRPMHPKDDLSFLRTERGGFSNPWTAGDLRTLRQMEAPMPTIAELTTTGRDGELLRIYAGHVAASPYPNARHALEIQDICVRPELRRIGVASRLLCEAIAQYRGSVDEIIAPCGVRNSDAASFFSYHNFGESGVYPNYFRSIDPFEGDALLYTFPPQKKSHGNARLPLRPGDTGFRM
jgi:ribosomal protein S18 acetylase RimI-like enzyme